jgi:hypothetical protein
MIALKHARLPHPRRPPRLDPVDRVRALRAARPLQRRQADGTVWRRQAARASSYPRQLPEGEVDRCKVRYGEDSRASTPGTLRE